MSVVRAAIPTIIVLVVAVWGCGGNIPVASSPASEIPKQTNAPVVSPTTSIHPTVVPSPSGVAVLGVSGSGTFGPGTYATAFQPPLTITLADRTVAGANGTIAYESIGEVDVNEPAWVDITFGFDKPRPHGHGTWSADFFITRIDKVLDPKRSATLIDPPKDLATWISKLPGLRLTAPAAAVEIGGIRATQLDVVSGAEEVAIGPIPGITDPPAFGFGPHHPARFVVVDVGGHDVLIQIGADDDAAHFERAVEALQPLVDSIAWQ